MSLLPKSPRKRTLLAIFIVLIFAAAIDQLWVWHWHRIQVAYDTTRITSPIEPSGCPDYLAALNTQYSQGVTPDNNAAPLLLPIIGTEQTNPAWQTTTHKFLSLDPAPLAPQYNSLAQSLHAEKSDEQLFTDQEEAACNTPWNPTDHAQWATWIKANDHALGLLRTAVSRPKFYLPSVSETGATTLGHQLLISTVIPPMGKYRYLTRAALARSMMRLDAGDFDGFREDLLTTAKLAGLLSQAPTLIEYLVARTLDEKVYIAVQSAAASQKLTADQTQSLMREIAALPPMPAPVPQIDNCEHFVALDAICKLARLNNLSSDSSPDSFRLVPVNFNRCLRFANHHHDAMVVLFRDPSYDKRKKAFADLFAEETPIVESSGKIEHLIFELIDTDLSGSNKLYTTDLVHRDLALAALALRAYKLRTGKFPADLADLGPDSAAFLADRFSDKPLIYRPDADGYVLYSLGPNQADDAGAPKSTSGPATKDYDIVLRTQR